MGLREKGVGGRPLMVLVSVMESIIQRRNLNDMSILCMYGADGPTFQVYFATLRLHLPPYFFFLVRHLGGSAAHRQKAAASTSPGPRPSCIRRPPGFRFMESSGAAHGAGGGPLPFPGCFVSPTFVPPEAEPTNWSDNGGQPAVVQG